MDNNYPDDSFLGWVAYFTDPVTRLLPDDWKPTVLSIRHFREEITIEERRLGKEINLLEREIFSFGSIAKQQLRMGGNGMPMFMFSEMMRKCARNRLRYSRLVDLREKLLDMKDRLTSSTTQHYILDGNFRQARLATRQHGIHTAEDYREMADLLKEWREQQTTIDQALDESLEGMSTEETVDKEMSLLASEMGIPMQKKDVEKKKKKKEEEPKTPLMMATTADFFQGQKELSF